MLIYGVKAYTPKAILVNWKETGLEVNVEKVENRFLFHEQHAAQNHNTKTHVINPSKVWKKFK
jgi:DNA replication protein DnaD